MRSDAETPLAKALDKLRRCSSDPPGEPDLTGAQAVAVHARIGELLARVAELEAAVAILRGQHTDQPSSEPSDPDRLVLVRIETEPIPAGQWDALSGRIAELAAELGVGIGGHIVAAGEGWEPAPGAQPLGWAPLPVWDAVRLGTLRRVAELEADLFAVTSARPASPQLPLTPRIRERMREIQARLDAGEFPAPESYEGWIVRATKAERAIRKAIDLLRPALCRHEGQVAEVDAVLAVLTRGLGAPEPTSAS